MNVSVQRPPSFRGGPGLGVSQAPRRAASDDRGAGERGRDARLPHRRRGRRHAQGGIYTMLFPQAVGGAELSPYDAMTVIERLSTPTRRSAGASSATTWKAPPWPSTSRRRHQEGLRRWSGHHHRRQWACRAASPAGRGRLHDPRQLGLRQRHPARGMGAFRLLPHDAAGKDVIMGPHGQPSHRHPSSALDHQADGNWTCSACVPPAVSTTRSARRRTVRADAYDLRFRHRRAAPRRHPRRLASPATALGPFRWAVGVGRRMLDELVKVIVQRRDPFGKSSDSASFRFQFAQMEARFARRRAFVHEHGVTYPRPVISASSRPWIS